MEQEILKDIMNQSQYKVKCKNCTTVLYSKSSGKFKTCACGTISIDGGKNKTERRLVGDILSAEPVENE